MDQALTLDTDGPKTHSKFRHETANAYFVELQIKDTLVYGLVDTGACVTMASREFIEQIPGCIIQTGPENMMDLAGVVPGSKLNTVGSVTAAIRIGKFVSPPHKIIIVADSSLQFLIGIDFLDKYYVSIDAVGRQLRIGTQEERFYADIHPIFWPKQEAYKVVSTAPVLLGPRTCSTIEVKVKELEVDCEGCIEGLDLDNQPFLVPRSINATVEKATFIQCVNHSEKPITIHKGQKVGEFTPVGSAVQVIAPVQPDAEARNFSAEKLEQLFDLSETDLSEKQKQLVHALLGRHSGVIGMDDMDMGLTNTVEHHIEIEGTGPIKQRYRRFPEPLKSEIQEEINKLLQKDIIAVDKFVSRLFII